MKQGSSNRRSRSRGNAKRHGGGGRNNFESNHPDVKVRGTAQQVLEKYQALGRDAASSGDRIAAEGFYQHAEHYYRIANSDNGTGQDGSSRRERQNSRRSQHAPSTVAPEQAPQAEAEVEVKAPVQAEEGKGGAVVQEIPIVQTDAKQATAGNDRKETDGNKTEDAPKSETEAAQA